MISVGVKGSLKRCGGQGDLLSGSAALFAYYAAEYSRRTKESFEDQLLYGCVGACMLTRTAARLAFEKHRRALTTPAILKKIGPAFEMLFEAK